MAFSPSMRFTSLNTGYDVDTMVSNMMQAENMRLDKMKRSMMLDTYRQEQYQAVYNDLKTFQTDFLSVMKAGSLRSDNTYGSLMGVKDSKGEASTAVSIGVNSKKGDYSINVLQVAVADMYESHRKVGGMISSRAGFQFDAGRIRADASYDFTIDGVTKKIGFKDGDTFTGGTVRMQNGRLAAVFDNPASQSGTATAADLNNLAGQLKFTVARGGTAEEIAVNTVDASGNNLGSDAILADLNSQLQANFGSMVTAQFDANGKLQFTHNGTTSSRLEIYNTDPSVDSLRAIGFQDGVSVRGKTGALSDEEFVELMNTKLKEAFGMEGTAGDPSAKQKIEASVNADGGLSFVTNGYHSGFNVANGSYNYATLSGATGPDFSSRGTLDLSVGVGGTSKTISVETAGKSTEQVVAAINQQLTSVGMGNTITAEMKDGKLSFTNYSTTDNVYIGDTFGGIGSMKAMGFEGSITLGAGGGLAELGITSGSSAKLNVNDSVGKIFGGDLTGEHLFVINGTGFAFDESTSVQQLIDAVNGANVGAKLRYDSYTESFRLEADKTGLGNKIEMSGEFLTKNLGFGATATRAAADSVAVIDGTTLTRSENSYNFNGVDWTLNAVSDGELKVSSTTDTDKVMESIKAFVEGYNALITKLRDQTQTMRPKSQGAYFDPLTDEERADMKESDIKLWDENAKKGLLFNDTILEGIETQLRSVLNQSVTLDDGTRLSLSDIGITTTRDWTKGGQLEIQDENKLRESIEKFGDQIGTLFNDTTEAGGKGLIESVNDVINNAISTTGPIAKKAGIAGTYTETDNEIFRKLKIQNDAIEKMMETLATKEENYYMKFSRIEAAMSQANSQMQYVQSMFG